jgi:competence protein ComEC
MPATLNDMACCFLGGIAASRIAGLAMPSGLEPVILLLSLGLLVYGLRRQKAGAKAWGVKGCILAFWLFCGLLHGGCALWPGQGADQLDGLKVWGEGTILSVKELPEAGWSAPRLQMTVRLKGQGLKGPKDAGSRAEKIWQRQNQILLTLRGTSGTVSESPAWADAVKCYIPGARIRFFGDISPTEGPRNPGAFDYPAYLAAQGIYCRAETGLSGSVCLGQASHAARWLDALRRALQRRIRQHLPQAEAGIVEGCLLGQTLGMAKEDLETYRSAGIAHLFAVSGSHGSLILSLAACLHNVCPGRKFFWRRWLLSAGMLCFYTALTGFPLSMMRTLVMGILLLSAPAFGRKPEGRTALAAAVMIMLWHCPGSVQLAGFQLSFGVVLGLFRLTEWLRRTRLPGFLAVPAAAQLAGMPLQAYWFHQLQPAGLLINAAVMLLMGPLMVFSLTAGFLSPFSDSLAAGFWKVAGFMAWLMHKLTYVWAAAPWACWPFASRGWPFYVLWGMGLWLLPELAYYEAALASRLSPGFRRHRLWRHRRLAAAGLAVCLCLVIKLLPSDLEVVYLDAGEGDCIVIHTPAGKTWLIDGGGTPFSDVQTGKSIVLPYLRYRGVGRIEGIILTHHHEDHREGITELLGAIPVKHLWMPPLPEGGVETTEGEGSADQAFLSALTGSGADNSIIRSFEQSLPIEAGLRMTLWWPPALSGPSTAEWQGNNQSLVIALEHHRAGCFLGCSRRTDAAVSEKSTGFRWLFTGDAEVLSLQTLLAHVPAPALRADLLKLPHHGSKSSSCPAFYEAVQPAGVVSTGGRNQKGNLAPEIRSFFEGLGIPLWQTRCQGAVLTSCRRGRLQVRTNLP